MILYRAQNGSITRNEWQEGEPIPSDTVWIDLLNLSADEEKAIEEHLGFDVPSREEMREIEVSNRLYMEGGALVMTATLIAHSESQPETHAITFILTEKLLVTVRYVELQPFDAFGARLLRGGMETAPADLLIGLVERIINRLADMLEKIARNLDGITSNVFNIDQSEGINRTEAYKRAIQELGRIGDLDAKTRESLGSLSRLIGFLTPDRFPERHAGQIKPMLKDSIALSDYANFLSSRISFLLDATLGMISTDQNNIIKIFSVAAAVFLPPTLIASIYGMNFRHMPELDWKLGYPLAIGLMVLSAVLPYRYFKRKKWL